MGENTYVVIQFFENQKEIFDEALKTYKIYESNKNFITDEKLINNANEIKTILDMPEPYSKIKDLPTLSKEFLAKHKKIIDEAKITPNNDIKLELEEVTNALNSDYEFKEELKSGETLEEQNARSKEIQEKLTENKEQISDLNQDSSKGEEIE